MKNKLHFYIILTQQKNYKFWPFLMPTYFKSVYRRFGKKIFSIWHMTIFLHHGVYRGTTIYYFWTRNAIFIEIYRKRGSMELGECKQRLWNISRNDQRNNMNDRYSTEIIILYILWIMNKEFMGFSIPFYFIIYSKILKNYASRPFVVSFCTNTQYLDTWYMEKSSTEAPSVCESSYMASHQ